MKQTKEENESEVDVDQDFLDRVLNKLYDFGDAANSKRSNKKQKKRKKQTDVEDDYTSKINGEMDGTDLSQDEIRCTSTSAEPKTESAGGKKSNVEVVTFQDPRKIKKLKRAADPEAKPPEVTDKRKKDADEFLTIEKARLDVHRFGITGFQKQQQRVFEQDRAIMLGARPPKKEYVNYKLYQQIIKEKKMKEKEEATSDTQKKKRTSGKQKNVKRKSGSSGAEPSGQVGHFKNGMLVLSSKDIQKLNSKGQRRAR
ncbi:uncharacterized protein C1orf131 homolog [Trichomycterus rosablanca]|uniref:uncharacterized protein C1orf131 homolog n=1 Tax=Trichomycterus rosablanca TaxID=2290929 RepID=UPI002F35D0EC